MNEITTTFSGLPEDEQQFAYIIFEIIKDKYVKCQRLFRPQFSKVKTSFVSQIRQESDTLTPSEDVSDDTLV